MVLRWIIKHRTSGIWVEGTNCPCSLESLISHPFLASSFAFVSLSTETILSVCALPINVLRGLSQESKVSENWYYITTNPADKLARCNLRQCRSLHEWVIQSERTNDSNGKKEARGGPAAQDDNQVGAVVLSNDSMPEAGKRRWRRTPTFRNTVGWHTIDSSLP